MADITLTASVRQSLLSLQSTQDMVGRTQKRLSSGLEVENAIDDAIAYFQAKALNDRSTDLLEKKDNIDQGVSTIAAALDGVTAIEEIVAQMKGVANSMKSAQQSQMSNLISTFQELRTQINNVASDATYQGLNLINGTGANLAVEFSEKTASKIDVNSVDLRNNTGGLDITNPVTYSQAEVLGVIANLADVSTFSNGEIINRYLTTADSLTFTWNAGASTFRAGETVEFTYGTGGAVNFFIGTAADLVVTNTGTVVVDIYSTSTTAASTETIYAMATASRRFAIGYAAQTQSQAATNANAAGTYTAVFTFTYHGDHKLTLTTADNGVNIGTGFGGDAQLYIGQGDSLVITTGEVVTLFSYSNDTAGSAAAVAQSRDAYLIATGLQEATKCLATADTQAFTSVYGINLGSYGLTSITGGDFNLTTNSNVAAVQAGNTDQINTLLGKLNTALTTLRTQSQVMGTNVALLNTRLEYTEDYVNTLQIGADKMTLADINVEGANLLALQTRQQLGIQSLSLAAQAEASILRLFG